MCMNSLALPPSRQGDRHRRGFHHAVHTPMARKGNIRMHAKGDALVGTVPAASCPQQESRYRILPEHRKKCSAAGESAMIADPLLSGSQGVSRERELCRRRAWTRFRQCGSVQKGSMDASHGTQVTPCDGAVHKRDTPTMDSIVEGRLDTNVADMAGRLSNGRRRAYQVMEDKPLILAKGKDPEGPTSGSCSQAATNIPTAKYRGNIAAGAEPEAEEADVVRGIPTVHHTACPVVATSEVGGVSRITLYCIVVSSEMLHGTNQTSGPKTRAGHARAMVTTEPLGRTAMGGPYLVVQLQRTFLRFCHATKCLLPTLHFPTHSRTSPMHGRPPSHAFPPAPKIVRPPVGCYALLFEQTVLFKKGLANWYLPKRKPAGTTSSLLVYAQTAHVPPAARLSDCPKSQGSYTTGGSAARAWTHCDTDVKSRTKPHRAQRTADAIPSFSQDVERKGAGAPLFSQPSAGPLVRGGGD